MKNNSPLLVMENITKSFPGVKALKGASIKVRAGEVHALMGENGAGKSTLMKCLFGVYKMDGGEIFLEGEKVLFKNSKDALDAGVAMVHQELNQAGKRSVADNMWLGRYPKRWKHLPFVDDREKILKTKEVFEELSIDINPQALVSSLSVSRRQMIEIARAVSYGAKIIVFDEPTSSLNEKEAERLFEIIDLLKSRGCGIIYISHKMEEILRISDAVTVMRDGAVVESRRANDITSDEIIRLMVGRELSERYPAKREAGEKVLLEVSDLSSADGTLKEISFTLKEGEILGVAGLDGAGRTELLENLFGLTRRSSGEIYLKGEKIFNRTPREAIKNRFALVTEERRATGIFGVLSVAENTAIPSLKKFMRGPFVSAGEIRKTTVRYIKALGIKTPDENTKIRTLSGGNQQKVIFSRWLTTEPEILMLDEPTRGIDVGAKYEIYKLATELAEGGRGIIMVSSEMPELIGLCDRILVMSGGRAAGILPRNPEQEDILKLATKFV